jgi:hypothetical protein
MLAPLSYQFKEWLRLYDSKTRCFCPSESKVINGARSHFLCYVLKLRMSSFLQNGAWPHLFGPIYSQGLALLSGSDFVLMLIIGLNFICEHYFLIKSDPRTMPAQPFSRFFHHTAFAKLQ